MCTQPSVWRDALSVVVGVHCWHRFGIGGVTLQSTVQNHFVIHCIVEFFMMNGLSGDAQYINN